MAGTSNPDALSGRVVVTVTEASTVGDSGPVGLCITAASWAAAARALGGEGWVVTPEGIFAPDEALARASHPTLAPRRRRWWRRYVPEACITAVKDVRDLSRARRFRRQVLRGPWAGRDVAFVWQHHQLFQTAGLALARALGRPLVLFVDAPSVWEDAKLGVRRPGWGRVAEAVGERPQLRAADVVACVSEEVAAEIRKRGVPARRIIVTPCGVDLSRFTPEVSGGWVRERLGLAGKFVAGWVGSFRPFHALESLLEAAARLKQSMPDLALLLVGDGQERRRLQNLARTLRLSDVVFTGTVPHAQVPAYIAAMDVAVLTGGEPDFHYSPIKLREYMASGKPVVAPRVGEVGRFLTDRGDALVVAPRDSAAIARALETLFRDRVLRESLGRAAREKIVEGSWTAQLGRALNALDGRLGAHV